MRRSKAFRFGAKATKATSAKEWTDLARHVEELGYYSLHVDDHFGAMLASMPAVTAAAMTTSTLKVGPLVAGNDFRNPVVLAREAAAIDLLSGGRLILGLGAGWLHSDYSAAGIEQADASTRIARLGETIQICRGVWSGEEFSFHGDHYRVSAVIGYPTPAAPIPILIGGGGRQVLTLGGRVADVVSINPKIVGRTINERTMAGTAASLIDQRVAWVQEAAGARFEEIELQLHVMAAEVTPEPAAVALRVAETFKIDPDAVLSSPHFQIGSETQIADNLQAARERWGFNFIVFPRDATASVAPVVQQLSGN